jgi:hypothetical protein
MRLTRNLLAAVLSFSLVFVSFLSFSVQHVSAQDSKIAIQRGYRTGYSDGYMSGYRDAIENASRSYERHKEYSKADRAYAKEFGSLEDYRDGYQQGFENGYNTGFGKQNFNAALPTDLKKRGAIAATVSNVPQETVIKEPVKTETAIKETTSAQQSPTSVEANTNIDPNTTAVANQPIPANTANTTATVAPTSYEPVVNQLNKDSIIVIPVETELIVEILSDINTNQNKEGDRFQARVVSPAEISGAIIEGRISRIQKPGRIKRRSEMTLSFDQIRVSDYRWSNFNALLAEVLPLKGDNVKRVDVEGTVEGKSSLKGDLVKVGAAAGTGVVIGAIAGGPVGAVVGGSVGTAFGVGAVVIERGKHVKLVKGQQLRIKTVYETKIR